MRFVPMSELLYRARSERYAVPGFCVWNAETIEVVLRVATEVKAPVILMSGPGEFPLLSPRDLSAIAQALAKRFDVPAALHLDHGDSLEQVEICLAAGYSSVMLDFSTRPFDENVDALRRVAKMAHPLGVSVEGELGRIGRADQVTTESHAESTLTDPVEAAVFVKETGIDALAVSIGNAHGHYTTLPRLDFDRLARLHEAIQVPLVLHGGSGTPRADVQRAISLGIAKVNVASDVVTAARQSLLEQWVAGKNLWVPAAQVVAMQKITNVLRNWFLISGAAGHA